MTSLVRFLMTGFLATLVHVVSAYGLISRFGVQVWLANGIAFALATAISLLINTLWSFERKLTAPLCARYLVVTSIGLLVTMIVSGTADRLGFHKLAGIAAVVVVAPPLVFLMHSRFTYRRDAGFSPPTSGSGGR